MEDLRSIALTVDEGDPGCVTWVLIESHGDAAAFDGEVDHSEETYPTYGQALDAGTRALKVLVGDLDVGPRKNG